MNEIRLTVLVENTARGHGLLAEHGLAFWIELGSRRILFDTGQSDILRHNADRLEIELGSADALVLSHGHYDHTGGLVTVLDCSENQPCPVFIHPDALATRYARNSDGTSRSIGMPEEARAALVHASRIHATIIP